MDLSVSSVFAKGSTAVITGASTGIGRACAIYCSKHGMNVWMADIDAHDLEIALSIVKTQTTDDNQFIQSVHVDVSKKDEMATFAQLVFSHESTKRVSFLMNNAAIQIGGGPLDTPMNIFEEVLGVNTLGPIHGCQAFIPMMQKHNFEGLIVNTGSKQGITAPPGNLTYNVSKAALKTWTEGLEHELMQQRMEHGGKLFSALLIPGWVNTDIHLKEQKMRADKNGQKFDANDVFFHEGKPAPGAWMPMQVIEFMIEELRKGRFYVVCPDNDVDRGTDDIRITWAMVCNYCKQSEAEIALFFY
eukprot:scaffold395_cov265-Chaetoceros_neogracile.AAC.41